MHLITSATVVATTARANDITLFASLELSKSKWVVTINSPGSEKFSRHVVEGGDGAGLLDLLSRSRAKAEQRYGVPIKAIVIQEAGLDGFWIHRLLLAEGIESHVVGAGPQTARRLVALCHPRRRSRGRGVQGGLTRWLNPTPTLQRWLNDSTPFQRSRTRRLRRIWAGGDRGFAWLKHAV